MKLAIEHDFDLEPAAYVDLYFDETFAAAMCASVKLGRTLLRLDRTPARVVRHVRCEPAREIPAPVAKLLGGARFSYVEELDFDVTARRGRWRIVPSALAAKVRAEGTLAVEPAGAGARRVVGGEIEVRVLGVGGLVQRFVVAEVERSYGDAAAFTRRWIAERRG